MTILEMKEKRCGLVAQAREILESAKSEKRDLGAEDTQKYDSIMADVDKMAADIKREERLSGIESEMETRTGNPVKPEIATASNATNVRASEQDQKAFRNYMLSGETRDLQAGGSTGGNSLYAPEQFVAQVIKATDNSVFMRKLATIYSVTSSDTLGIPVMTANPDDADWTSEIAAVTTDTGLAFGKRELKPNLLSKLEKISLKLLRTSAIPIDSFVADRLGYKFGTTLEKAYLTGSGVNQPLGIFTASANGIDASRDVATGNTATTITFDGLIAAKYALKGQYRANASFIFSRTAMQAIQELKDLQGRYLWEPSTQLGTPDKVLGIAVYESEYVPAAFTTGSYVGAIGDFKQYYIADSLALQLQRINELYAGTNQIGFIGRFETDGAPVLAEAFARITLA